MDVNSIQDGGGGGQKASLISFFPVTYTNLKISPKDFQTFIFNSFATLV